MADKKIDPTLVALGLGGAGVIALVFFLQQLDPAKQVQQLIKPVTDTAGKFNDAFIGPTSHAIQREGSRVAIKFKDLPETAFKRALREAGRAQGILPPAPKFPKILGMNIAGTINID